MDARIDLKRFQIAIQRMAAVFNRDMPQIVQEEYWNALCRFGIDRVERVMRVATSQCTYFPVPAILIELCERASEPVKTLPEQAVGPEEKHRNRLRAAYWLQHFTWNRPMCSDGKTVDLAERERLVHTLSIAGSQQFVRDHWDAPKFFDGDYLKHFLESVSARMSI